MKKVEKQAIVVVFLLNSDGEKIYKTSSFNKDDEKQIKESPFQCWGGGQERAGEAWLYPLEENLGEETSLTLG